MTRLQQVIEELSDRLGSYAALARELQASPGLVNDWVHRERVPEPWRLDRMAELSGLELAALKDMWWEAYARGRARVREQQQLLRERRRNRATPPGPGHSRAVGHAARLFQRPLRPAIA